MNPSAKNSLVQFVRFATLITLLVTAGCKPNPVEKLSKKWKPVDVTGDGVSKEVKEGILRPGNMMEFTRDGRFISFSAGEKSDTGTYSLSENGKILTVFPGAEPKTVMNVQELKANRTVIENHGLVLVLEPAE